MTDHLPGRARVLPVGDRALLVDCADAAEALALWQRLRAAPPAGVVEPVVAACTVLVRVGEGTVDRVRAELERWVTGRGGGTAGGTGDTPVEVVGGVAEVVLATVYDGADLPTVARLMGTSVEAVVARHQETLWVSAFLGFAPGFAYLRAVGDWPEIARHASPRTRVPAGSVALAGTWSAVYPSASPGGWQLLGRTDAAVWDLDLAEPALLPPGTRVRFAAVRGRAVLGSVGGTTRRPPDAAGRPQGGPGRAPVAHGSAPGEAGPPTPAAAPPRPDGVLGRPALEVLEPGPLCLVQDLGRRGHLSLGVPTSGALDRRALVRANLLVGNDRGRAVLEVLLGGLVLRALEDVVVAVTGAPTTVRVEVSGRAGHPEAGRPFLVPAGGELALGAPARGLRTYVAVRGGLGGPTVLGSRATDVLSGLGPPPLRAGDVLRLLPAPGTAVAGAPDEAAHDVPAGPEHTVHVLPGPRVDWLTPAAIALLATHRWEVTPRSNRVGLRLGGPVLERAVTAELPSEGTVPGSVQVPPDGRPVVFLADHPVTGGYPVVAVVRDADLDLLGQLRPGDRLRLLPPSAGLRVRR